MKLIEQIKEVMSEHTDAAHVNDIAQMVLDGFPDMQIELDKLPSKISSVLSSDVRKISTKSSFSKVKNKTGGFKKGVYRFKKKVIAKPMPPSSPKITNQYTKKAGETAVISELLFYGFNASAMVIGDGIDIIAGKKNKYFHIRVKTPNPTDSGVFEVSLKRSSFIVKDSLQTFYIFVLRENDTYRYNDEYFYRYYNDYLILPSSQIRQFIDVGTIKDGTNFSIWIQKDKRNRYLLNATEDVTASINTFGQII
jgi:hypothetical protein